MEIKCKYLSASDTPGLRILSIIYCPIRVHETQFPQQNSISVLHLEPKIETPLSKPLLSRDCFCSDHRPSTSKMSKVTVVANAAPKIDEQLQALAKTWEEEGECWHGLKYGDNGIK